MMPILIIGAGFAGAASAYFLSQIPGLKIRLVEREVTFGLQASGKNAAMLRQAVSDLQTARRIQETLRFLQDPPADFRKFSLFEKTGSLLLGDKQKLTRLYENLQKVGGCSQWVSTKKLPTALPSWLQAVFPANTEIDGLFCPDDGIIHLKNFLGGLLAGAEQRGVEIFYHHEVTEILPTGHFWQIRHGAEKFQASAIVNAAGAWCDSLIRMAGLKELNLVPHRRHLFMSRGWKFCNEGLPLVWDVEREVYFRPDRKEVMLSPGDETPHPAVSPPLDPGAESLLVEKLHQAFPGLAPLSFGERWACLRTKNRDGTMCVKKLLEKPGYFTVAGLGGHGVGASMGLGSALRDQVRDWLGHREDNEIFRVTDKKKGSKSPALGNG